MERFEEKYIPEPNSGCWLWTASTSNGYGIIKVRGRFRGAHRVSYEIYRGAIPPGFVTDHLCRVPCCVNPDHLEVVTIGENVRRGDNHHRRKTACKRGHPFTPENTYERINNLTPKPGHRFCWQSVEEASRILGKDDAKK